MADEIQATTDSEGESNQDAIDEVISEISGESVEAVKAHESEDTSDKVEEEAFDREVQKGANRKAAEARAESEESESDEPERQQERRKPQPQQQTYQQLQQEYNQLEQAVGELNQMRQNNQIGPQEYQQAIFKAQSMQNNLRQQHLDNEFNSMQSHKQSEQRLRDTNKAIVEAIPDWADKTKRANIQAGMKEFMFNKYSVSAEQVEQWGMTATPTDFRMMYDNYKAAQPKPKRKSPPRRKAKAKKIDTSYQHGSENQADAIATLLESIGAD